MIVKQDFPDTILVKRCLISAHELVIQAVLVCQALMKIVLVPGIDLQRHVVLGVHGIHLSLGRFFLELGANEELRHPIESLLKCFIGALKMIVGVGLRGKSIVHTSVVAHEL